MLFGMSWWASIFVLAALVIIAYEIKAQTSHEGLEEETTSDFLLFVGRQLYFVALMLLAVLSYQDSSHPLVYWPLVYRSSLYLAGWYWVYPGAGDPIR